MNAPMAGWCPSRPPLGGERYVGRPGLFPGRLPRRGPSSALLAAVAWLPACVAAAEPVAAQASAWGALAQALLALLLVLAALFAFLWLLRRLSPMQSGAQGAVRVVGGVMLGTRERLVIVEVADQWLLIGVGAGQVSHLHTMPRPAGYSAPAERDAHAGFSGKLAEFLGRFDRR